MKASGYLHDPTHLSQCKEIPVNIG